MRAAANNDFAAIAQVDPALAEVLAPLQTRLVCRGALARPLGHPPTLFARPRCPPRPPRPPRPLEKKIL